MQLLIENTLTAENRLVELINKSYQIGRGNECDIVLTSPFVSRIQASIEYSRQAFVIEPHGMNGTYLNEVELKKTERVPLGAGDKIRIGEYVLSVSSGAQQKATEQQQQQRLVLAKKFVEIEVWVHSELLSRLDLRKTELSARGEQKKWSDERLHVIHRHLSEILNDPSFVVEPEVEQHVVRETLKTELMDGITFRGDRQQRDFNMPNDEYAGQHEDEIGDLKFTLVAELELDNDPKSMRENAQKVEKGFEKAMDRHWLDMSSGFRRYVLRRRIRKDIHDMVVGLGPLQDLINYPNISEIMVVSRDQIYIEKGGKIEDSGRAFVSDEIGLSIIERIVAPIGRRIDKSQPLVDARLADGSRVNAIIPPLALKGPCITIRKFSPVPYTIDDLVENRTLNSKAALFLKACVLGKKNMIISGGTGSGKTSLLNVLSSFIKPEDRIITIEDSAELKLKQRHVVQLETKPANIEGSGAFTVRDLVKNSLRMRPDRIVVGECRSGETLDMLQAMNTGHSGSMTTGHANSPEDMILRLETMVLMAMAMPIFAIRSQIASALDLIVQQCRFGEHRRVTQITEVVEFDERENRVILEDIFVYRRLSGDDGDGELVFTGYIPTFLPELLSHKDVKDQLTLEQLF
ncbi:MAG TPA: ATPase, T2SS/T4P/T4SS family [Candidatus Angelobacter sp.]|jgi:Flp pilus assembly CpaF family ATPase/pSer/pThr/pTyr-binding forkhead associated (FHA) protein|nr:ATPase, T2SS/T4P/T4SS family [Candidatus Angelobacter sp.]